jgi:hypothetical protein
VAPGIEPESLDLLPVTLTTRQQRRSVIRFNLLNVNNDCKTKKRKQKKIKLVYIVLGRRIKISTTGILRTLIELRGGCLKKEKEARNTIETHSLYIVVADNYDKIMTMMVMML